MGRSRGLADDEAAGPGSALLPGGLEVDAAGHAQDATAIRRGAISAEGGGESAVQRLDGPARERLGEEPVGVRAARAAGDDRVGRVPEAAQVVQPVRVVNVDPGDRHGGDGGVPRGRTREGRRGEEELDPLAAAQPAEGLQELFAAPGADEVPATEVDEPAVGRARGRDHLDQAGTAAVQEVGEGAGLPPRGRGSICGSGPHRSHSRALPAGEPPSSASSIASPSNHDGTS